MIRHCERASIKFINHAGEAISTEDSFNSSAEIVSIQSINDR